ncbi:hypothetical protein CANARDRAFT_26688 [[Candida] arabinofermentans NRRL YB-2248]|uniref:B30.2/SPRY domain-containing protein n=1 Tax=[Candida] arabinofermentans NRRL YB-2248 TaxID=983967 RepID=A0A1E4T693_9ASCO|nr:hypothetical protein CANARDRAFT_26688 [[Candida] arabinofermentans NRRL YB-2248]
MSLEDKTFKRQKIAPRLKPLPYSLHDLEAQLKKPTLTKQLTINNTAFYANDDNPLNKRGFQYKPCRPNPFFESTLYSTSDLPPFTTRLSYFDKSPGIFIDSDCTQATALQGWRSIRANVPIQQGKWYVEFKIIKGNDVGDAGNSHVRFGFGRKEASLEAPVGFDGYGYGFRDKFGQCVHLSKPGFTPGNTMEDDQNFKTGDVIGLLIELPSIEVQEEIVRKQIEQKTVSQPTEDTDEIEEQESKKAIVNGFEDSAASKELDSGVIRDQIPIKYKNQLYFEQYDYNSSTQMEHLLNPVTVFGEKAIPDKEKFKPCRLPQSSITLFKNGKNKGVAFESLYSFLPPSSEQKLASKRSDSKGSFNVSRNDGSLGYYPMVSCFNKGIIQLCSGPDLEVVPKDIESELASGEIRMYCERYSERVIEEYVYDLIDEVTNKYLDDIEDSLPRYSD